MRWCRSHRSRACTASRSRSPASNAASRRGGRRLARGSARVTARGVGALVAAALVGWRRLRLRRAGTARAPRTLRTVRRTPVALAQANLGAAARWEDGGATRTLDAYLRLTREAFERGDPEIVFWPEAALTLFLEREPLYQRALGVALRPRDAELGGRRAARRRSRGIGALPQQRLPDRARWIALQRPLRQAVSAAVHGVLPAAPRFRAAPLRAGARVLAGRLHAAAPDTRR